MGIFDIFKTKVGEAAGKAGDVAGDVKDKVSDMFDGDKAEDTAPVSATDTPEAQAEKMVSEGAPVADTGEAAPGAGDDGSGMTGTIKQNVSIGVDKAAEMADSATGRKYSGKIQSGADKAKDVLS